MGQKVESLKSHECLFQSKYKNGRVQWNSTSLDENISQENRKSQCDYRTVFEKIHNILSRNHECNFVAAWQDHGCWLVGSNTVCSCDVFC